MKLVLCSLVTLFACGGSKVTPDAAGVPAPDAHADAGGDSAIDAEPDAAPLLPVSVTVYDSSHVPAAGMPVIFLDGTDTLLSSTMTDASGTASAIVPAGSSVTAQSPMPPSNVATPLTTFLDVKPGDALVVGTPPDAATYTTVSVDLPSLSGAMSYGVDTSCGPHAFGSGSASAPTAMLSVSCAHPDVYVRAISNSRTLGWIYKPAVNISSGHLDFTAEAYQPLTTIDMTLDSMPVAEPAQQIQSWVFKNDARYDYSLSAGYPTHSAHQTAQVFLPAIAKSEMDIEVDRYNSDTSGRIEHFERVPFGTTYAFDLAQHPTPWMTHVVATGNTITWTEVTTGPMDVAIVQLFVNGPQSYHWTVAGPYSPGALRLPTLPAPFSNANLRPNQTAGAGTVACLVRVPGGWDRVRNSAVVHGELLSTVMSSAAGAIAYPSGSLPP